MARVKFYKITDAELSSLAIREGQLILTTDTKKLFLDTSDSNRIEMNGSDTDTTYTAGTGLNLVGTEFNNAGVRAITTGNTNGTLNVNTNGIDAEVTVKGINNAAFKDVDSSIAAASTSTKLPTSAAVAGFVEGKNYITKAVNNLDNYELKSNTGSTFTLSINPDTYELRAVLKNSAGDALSTQTVDLPLETMVVNASYDSVTKEIVLTLQSGSTVRFSVADLVAGLQSEITSTNKLSSDLVDDSNNNNKFTNIGEKQV